MGMRKRRGLCPHCRRRVAPRVLWENRVRRDLCRCSACGGLTAVCSVPRCGDYARAGQTLASPFCDRHLARAAAVAFILSVELVATRGALTGKRAVLTLAKAFKGVVG